MVLPQEAGEQLKVLFPQQHRETWPTTVVRLKPMPYCSHTSYFLGSPYYFPAVTPFGRSAFTARGIQTFLFLGEGRQDAFSSWVESFSYLKRVVILSTCASLALTSSSIIATFATCWRSYREHICKEKFWRCQNPITQCNDSSSGSKALCKCCLQMKTKTSLPFLLPKMMVKGPSQNQRPILHSEEKTPIIIAVY